MGLEHWGQSFTKAPIPFAQLPPAASVEGRVERLAELPHVSLIALGGIWRPFGGRQVLASRVLNPVTVQNLSGQVAETIGPFPGGLVRARMQLRLNLAFVNGAVGNGSRVVQIYAGPSGASGVTGQMAYWQTTVDNIKLNGEFYSRLDVRADGSANHVATPSSAAAALGTMAAGYQAVTQSPTTPLVDFSQPWEITIPMQSAAETAVAISTATWVGGVATYNTSAVHTLAVGDKTTIAGVDRAGYNGVVIVGSIVDTDTFTAVIADPGGSGTGGTSSRISNMKSQSYVLELVG